MHPSIPKLFALLQHLDGHDVCAMPIIDSGALPSGPVMDFRNDVLQRFAGATEDIHHLLLGDRASEPSWLWSTQLTEYAGTSWLATYRLVSTDSLERALATPQTYPIPASMLMSCYLELALCGARTRSPARGPHIGPTLELSITIHNDSHFDMLEELACHFDSYLSQRRGMKVAVYPTENCCDTIENPSSVARALTAVIKAIRDLKSLEGVRILVEIDRSADALDVETMLNLFGRLFSVGVSPESSTS